MAYKEVEITDDYINEMAEYFECQGKILRDMAEAYCSILRRVEREGISEGKSSEGIANFLMDAERIQQMIFSVSKEIRDCSLNYLEEIDSQDRYLY